MDLKIIKPTNPITHPWHAAKQILQDSTDSEFCSKFVTHSEYSEHGSRICYQKFDDFYS